MTYIDLTKSPEVLRYIYKNLGKEYTPTEIGRGIAAIKLPHASEIDADYVLDLIRDEIPLLEDAD